MNAEYVSIVDLTVADAGPEAGWSATLLLGGKTVGRLHGAETGTFTIESSDKTSPSVATALLEAAVAADADTINMPDGSIRPETAADRIADLVASKWLTHETAKQLSGAVVAIVDEKMVEILVPIGGTVQDARSHMLITHPDALILNDMPIEKATMIILMH